MSNLFRNHIVGFPTKWLKILFICLSICALAYKTFHKSNDLLYCHSVIALSHIHVSAAYRSRIYENVDTPRSEPYFARETYVPRPVAYP